MPTGGEGDRREGGCQCGAVRYAIAWPPREVYVCHCSECRAQSASAFGISVIVERGAHRHLQGALAVWSRPTTAGSAIDCHFCPICGTRLWHIGRDDPSHVSVKGGSLDEPPDLSAARHIWVASALQGVAIPEGAERFDGEPDG